MQRREGVIAKVVALFGVAAMAAAAGSVVTYFVMRGSSSPLDSSMPDIYDASVGVDVAPSLLMPAPTNATGRMSHTHVSFANTVRANYTLAAGITTVHGEDGEEQYHVRSETLVDLPFGEFTTSEGLVSSRSYRLVITDAQTGARTIVVPFGLSAAAMSYDGVAVSLRPTFFFVQHIPSARRRLLATDDVGPFSTFASSAGICRSTGVCRGRLFSSVRDHQQKLDNVVGPFLKKYWSAAKADIVAGLSHFHGRQLGEWGSRAGSWAGSKIGSHYGKEVGADLGAAGGGAAGAAIGGAVAGPIGADVGEDLGSFAGREVGGWAGGKIGGDLGGWAGGEIGGWF